MSATPKLWSTTILQGLQNSSVHVDEGSTTAELHKPPSSIRGARMRVMSLTQVKKAPKSDSLALSAGSVKL